MPRPLAWVLALVAVAVTALLLATRRDSQGGTTPDADLVFAQRESTTATEVQLASAPEEDARTKASSSDSTGMGARASALGITEGSIEVRVVRDEDGSPLEAEVVIAPHGPWEHIPALETQKDGTVRKTALRLGNWVVRANSPRRAERVEFVTLTAESPNATVLMRMQPPSVIRDVHVRIVDAEGRLATPRTSGLDSSITMLLDVRADPKRKSPGSRMAASFDGPLRVASESEPDGLHWKIPLRDDRGTCIHLLLADRVISTRAVIAGQNEVEFLLQDLLLSTSACDVLVLDGADDTPVPGAKVTFHLGNRQLVRTSDEAGHLRFEQVPSGESTLTVDAAGFAGLRQNVQIPLASPLVLRLGVPRRIHGIVLDAAGEPIANVPLTLHSTSDAILRTGTTLTFSGKSGPDGRFEFGSLWHESYVVGAGWPPIPPVAAGDDETRIARFMTRMEVVVSESVDVRAGDALGVVLRVDRKKP